MMTVRDEARRLFREVFGDAITDFDFARHNRCRDCGAVPDVASMMTGNEHGTKGDELAVGVHPPECMHDLCVARRKSRWTAANPADSGGGCVKARGWVGGVRTNLTKRRGAT